MDCGHDHHAEPLGWIWDPWIVGPLLLSAMLFAFGWARLHARSGRGAGELRRLGWLFAGGWLTLAGALLSPLHESGERSFAAHMTEHELLMLLAAPLLVVMLWAFPPAGRRRLGQLGASRPVAAAWAGGARRCRRR